MPPAPEVYVVLPQGEAMACEGVDLCDDGSHTLIGCGYEGSQTFECVPGVEIVGAASARRP